MRSTQSGLEGSAMSSESQPEEPLALTIIIRNQDGHEVVFEDASGDLCLVLGRERYRIINEGDKLWVGE
jgi:hypothetical protein